MSYIIAGSALIDDIVCTDGTRRTGLLGGSLYALAGIKPFCDDVLLVTTAGSDFADYYGPYFRANDLSFAGVYDVLPHTQHNVLTYQPDGRWHEESAHGPAFSDTWGERALIRIEQVLPFCDMQTKGIYLESNSTEPIWRGLPQIRAAAPQAKIMWEIPPSDCENSERFSAVRNIIKNVDVFSLNLPESYALFGTTTEAQSIAALIELGTPCFFRVGTRGASMIQDGRAWYAPAYDMDTTVDPTGCGNCSTGAALYGFAEGLHPHETVIRANLAAGLNARQHGPFPVFTAAVRTNLMERVAIERARLYQEG